MSLKDYYEGLDSFQPSPKADFRKTIADACGVVEMTVYRWLSGEVVPDKLKREKIAEISGVPEKELFPEE